ncbi:MAG: serine acetyltransferase [Deltaproteobacteria bacterium]|nr:serine acetyltransferase [Deltaproteobacteria bacterium]
MKPLSELVDVVKEDWDANGRDWTRPGFRALAVHRFGNWRMNVDSKLARAPLSVLYRAAFRYVRNHYGIELPYSAHVGRQVVIEHQGGIVVHGDTTIGDRCVIRQGVTLGMKNVGKPFDAPTLGEGVDVGAGAVVLGAITVGDGASIGANSVVLADVAAGDLAVGVPAQSKKRKKKLAAAS